MAVTLRFVLLQHTGVPSPHFDLMIESALDAPLLTWRCPHDPFTKEETSATRIADHRREYLTYEGEISGGRGEVRRVRDGQCTPCPDGSFLMVSGDLRRTLVIASSDSAEWLIRRY